jgi:hypothetical protein
MEGDEGAIAPRAARSVLDGLVSGGQEGVVASNRAGCQPNAIQPLVIQ